MCDVPLRTPRDHALLPRIYLGPGMLHSTCDPLILTTVLGSCVSVCLIDRRRRVAGMNHFVLPHNGDRPSDPRYGDAAIEMLVEETAALCGDRGGLEAKVFGGAEVLSPGMPRESVGARNVAAALLHLERLSIPIVARRTGDVTGLVVHLHSASGDVLVRPITPQSGWIENPASAFFYD